MVYVNYGCGFHAAEGWLNVDASPTLRFERLPLLGSLYTKNEARFPPGVRYADIVKGPVCAPGTAKGVYASHVLEHLAREDALAALRHTYAMLGPGGVFRVIVPDLESRARRYLEGAEKGDGAAADRFMRDTLLGRESRPAGFLGRLAALVGHQAHLWMWDERSLVRAMADAGFKDIRRCRLGDADDPMFARVEVKERFDDDDYGPELALEGRK